MGVRNTLAWPSVQVPLGVRRERADISWTPRQRRGQYVSAQKSTWPHIGRKCTPQESRFLMGPRTWTWTCASHSATSHSHTAAKWAPIRLLVNFRLVYVWAFLKFAPQILRAPNRKNIFGLRFCSTTFVSASRRFETNENLHIGVRNSNEAVESVLDTDSTRGIHT